MVVHVPANSAQRLQIFPSVYSSLVIVDFIEHDETLSRRAAVVNVLNGGLVMVTGLSGVQFGL